MKQQKIAATFPNVSQDGISLRDHLAATALASILKFRLSEGPEKNAKEAYRIADAMIRERDLSPNEPVELSQETNESRDLKGDGSKQESVQGSAPSLSEKVTLTPTEFASLFGKSFNWTYRQIYAGKIKVISDFGRMMVPRSEVDRLLQQREIYSGKK